MVFDIHISFSTRILGAFLLALVLFRFLTTVFADVGSRLLAFGLVLFGAGLGWLAAGFGLLTMDFWVPEAFPFLSSFINPHFPIGLALQIFLLTPLLSGEGLDWRQVALYLSGSLLLSLVYPFGWVVVVSVISVWLVLRYFQNAALKIEGERLALVIIGGAPYVLYIFMVIQSNPVLSQWNAQNLTLTPPLPEVLLALSPALLLALAGVVVAFRQGDAVAQYLSVWLILGLALVYLPLELQRRLTSGMFVPIAFLAIYGLTKLTPTGGWRRLGGLTLLVLALPTNLIILTSTQHLAAQHDPRVTIYTSEISAFEWLDANAASGALVLAAPQTGTLLPAYTSMRVLYGHPFETIQADVREAQVTGFFSNTDWAKAEELLISSHVDYIFYGPRERSLGSLPDLPGWHVVYSQPDLEILAATP